MYNDYYLQLILQELQDQSTDIETIKTEVNEIKTITNSGDIRLEIVGETMKNESTMIGCILMLTLLFTLIMRCFK